MRQKDADGIAIREDPDQNAVIRSGCILFAQTCLSEKLKSLQ